jgi:hypothetical protein
MRPCISFMPCRAIAIMLWSVYPNRHAKRELSITSPEFCQQSISRSRHGQVTPQKIVE